jgi:hypothetical protein
MFGSGQSLPKWLVLAVTRLHAVFGSRQADRMAIAFEVSVHEIEQPSPLIAIRERSAQPSFAARFAEPAASA